MPALTPYLFDRLYGPPSSAPAQPDEIERCIARDIIWLLNCRAPTQKLLPPWPSRTQSEVLNSVVGFGLEDLTGSQITADTQNLLIGHIKQAIARFESRIDLRSLRIHPMPAPASQSAGIVYLEIHADVWLQGNPEIVEQLRLRAAFDLWAGRCQPANSDPVLGVQHV
jgi:type VI secretion system lysozyme-like protein